MNPNATSGSSRNASRYSAARRPDNDAADRDIEDREKPTCRDVLHHARENRMAPRAAQLTSTGKRFLGRATATSGGSIGAHRGIPPPLRIQRQSRRRTARDTGSGRTRWRRGRSGRRAVSIDRASPAIDSTDSWAPRMSRVNASASRSAPPARAARPGVSRALPLAHGAICGKPTSATDAQTPAASTHATTSKFTNGRAGDHRNNSRSR